MSDPRDSQGTYRRQLVQNPAFSRVFSLSLSAHAALVALVALVGVCRVASIAPVACFLDDESKPPERRKPLKFMGFFSFCWKFGPFVCTTLCRFLFEIVANQKFSGTPPTFHQKTKKPLNDLEHNQPIENCFTHSNKVYLQPLDQKWKSCFPYAMVEIVFQLTSS